MIGVTTWFALGTLGMLAGTIAFVWRGLSADSDYLQYYAILAAISLIATIAYAVMAMGEGWLEVDDRVVFIPRYVDWILTTPLLLAFLGMLADVDRDFLYKVVAVNTVVMVSGFVAAAISPSWRFGLFGLGGIAYVVLVYMVLGTMTERARERDSGTQSLFTSLRNLTLVLWTIYPVVWLLGPAGYALLTPTVDIMLIAYLDLLTKVGFGLIAINASAVIETEYETTRLEGGTEQPS
ncbi:bacteriorhodopsin [Natronobacterium gregoryi]|uniref:Bacteriorhodopsin n=2 Tax=Natronobacterium gregoryi TaxID=44930 RepID=L0AIV2_NATGS|nr:bacteriorhodopsin [Natronobacterium gregoryi]AFZ72995.1 bacteriorhodopsin [Natronobacterium gregoryi SP2]ELY70070.1 sensory rhodopsin II [Natronobacterium gregoryi SP2]PLK19080.1 sensory rhodopsin-2 [Natronobacterium gregoryi SP2]SFJ62482.1 sensory rhodopsin [Natronobacterium gregoryi]